MTAREPRKLRAARRRGLLEAPFLELGCGHGVHLAHAPPGSLGVDRDPAALATVSALGQRTERRDLATPGWSAGLGRWPLVFCADLLVHLPEPDVLLAELGELLAGGARALVVEWVYPRGPLLDGLCRALVPGAASHRRHPEHLHVFTERDLPQRFARHGLALEDTWVHSVDSRGLGALMKPLWPPRSFLLRAG